MDFHRFTDNQLSTIFRIAKTRLRAVMSVRGLL